MAMNDLAKNVADALDISVSEAAKKIDQMSAEQVINLESAVDAEDQDAIQSVWDETEDDDAEPTSMTVPEIKAEIQRTGKRNLETEQPMDNVWELIGKLGESDWKLMWPALDDQILMSLLSEITDEDVDSVSAEDAKSIYEYAKQMLTEHVIYQGAIVEVAIARGPNNTIGIRTPKGITMVSKNETSKLDEHVLGMTQMPALSRMLELAGMNSGAATTAPPVSEDEDEDRIYIKGGAGSISRSMMPIKLRRLFKELKQRLPDDLSNLEDELVKDDIDYDYVHVLVNGLTTLLTTIANNVDSARKE
jgi:hypothetical protein